METLKAISATVINLTQFRLESHVQKAFRLAWRLSGGRPVNAGHMLRAALLLRQKYRSAAYSELASLLPLSTLSEPATVGIPPADLGAMPFVKSLAHAFSVAESFVQDGFWGRDYITIALLAVADPSLAEIAQEAGTRVESAQDKWFEFVSTSQRRRKSDSWKEWWQKAGVPLPIDRPPSSGTMTAYLLLWNPDRYPWPDLEKQIKEIEDQGSFSGQWSTGNRRDITVGARVFLLRQGPERPGLVGRGEVKSSVVEAPHWDPEQREKGKKSLLAEIRWDALSREPIVNLTELVEQTGRQDLWSTQANGVEIEPELANKIEMIWKTAWDRHKEVTPGIESRLWIARFSADTGRKDDQLRISRYVNAFARVIASRSLTPPLSVGLFGDWGSGKTFFMDLLHDGIQELCEEAPENESPLYWRRICQIRFNAWHYAETNLWASLVSTIFNRLRAYLDGENAEADEFNRLLNKLEMAGELRRQAQETLTKAQTAREQARGRVVQAERALRELPEPPKPSEERLRGILSKTVNEVFTGKPKDFAALLKSAGDWSGREDLKTAAETLAKGQTTVEEARALLEEIRPLSSRAGFWWRILSAAKPYKSWVFWAVILVLLVTPVTAILAQVYLDFSEQWARFWVVIAEILTAGGAAIAWARSRLASASGVFGQLDSMQVSIERQIEEARSADRAEYQLQYDRVMAEEKKAKEELEAARLEQERAAVAEREAERALRESTSQARLGRFIRERASSADYEKHLGLIAMVHRDFQRLSDLMQKLREGDVDPDLPRVERIVLYIDDLDRCRPEKVVQVLEAIHLLLFFPLFVVVVGVDSRWISRALYRHYEDMLADEAMLSKQTGQRLETAPADSQDYLEKIFQVPFWLRRMEPAAVERLVHSLISPEEREAVPTETPESLGASAVDEDKPIFKSGPESRSRAETKKVTVEAECRRECLGEPLAPPTEGLTITESELEYMTDIASLMPRTPRSVKRFVNIYRLYKAGLSTLALERFLGTPGKPGNFQAVQVLLALVTGAPRFAQAVFQELNNGETGAKRLSDLVEVLEQKGEETWKVTLDALRGFAEGDNNIELAELQYVSPLVGRYSVHHMVSQSPGEASLG